jgi:hypothetical protein
VLGPGLAIEPRVPQNCTRTSPHLSLLRLRSLWRHEPPLALTKCPTRAARSRRFRSRALPVLRDRSRANAALRRVGRLAVPLSTCRGPPFGPAPPHKPITAAARASFRADYLTRSHESGSRPFPRKTRAETVYCGRQMVHAGRVLGLGRCVLEKKRNRIPVFRFVSMGNVIEGNLSCLTSLFGRDRPTSP